MDEFVGVRRHTGRKVGSLDQRHGKAAQRGVPRGTGTKNAASDDQHVENSVAERSYGSIHHLGSRNCVTFTCFLTASKI
jgi:hypothetical protein